jgi:hypothetical protein
MVLGRDVRHVSLSDVEQRLAGATSSAAPAPGDG